MTSSLLFYLFFILLVVQRIGELVLARKNATWILSQGGYEVGANHYKYIIMIHVGFFLSLLGEVTLTDATPPIWWWIPFLVFVFAQVLRYWCIRTLGSFWNTRIYILPQSRLIDKGPYRFMKHPNYLIVITEFVAIPLIFGAFYTAIVWTLINYLFLRLVRIPTEENALPR
jgi:methyltransferase